MRKCVLALVFLSSLAPAQKIPLLHRDHVDAERAHLHEKLTRLAETRQSLGMPAVQSGSAPELDALTARAEKKPARTALPRRAKTKAAVAENAWPPPPQVVAHDNQEPSLGEVARQTRAQKRQPSQK